MKDANGTVWVDNSTLTDVAACTTRTVLKKVYGFQRAEDGIAAEAGKAFHTALDVRFQGRGNDAALAAFRAAYAEYNARVVEPAANERDKYDLYRMANLERIVREWLTRHPDSALPWTVLPDGTEAELSHPLTDETLPNGAPRFMYWGKIDLRVRAHHDGRRYTVDHKTSQKIDAANLAKYDNDSQMTGYTFLESKLSPPDDQPAGVFINAIGIKDVPSSNRKCSTHGMLYAQCGHLHLDFVIQPTGRRPDQVEAWRRNAATFAAQYADMIDAYGNDLASVADAPMDGTFRNECKFCSFRTFCLSRRDDVDTLHANFVVDRWLPKALQPPQENAA